MNSSRIINKRDTARFPGWLTMLRIILGLILLMKGVAFFHDSTALETIMHRKGWDMFDSYAETIAFVITYVHLLGGLFIATGLFTRWCSIIHIPILIGAVIFNVTEGISFSNQELFLSAFTMVLAFVFAFKGSGGISADEFFRNYFMAGTESGHTQKFFQ